MSGAGESGMGRGALVFAAGMAVGLLALVAELGFLQLTAKRRL